MSDAEAVLPPDLTAIQVTVSVDGRRWRRLERAAAIADAGATERVFVVDPGTGSVQFGDGMHGAQPASGAVVRVSYRRGRGGGGNVAITWAGTWPPQTLSIAPDLTPGVVGECKT